MNSNEHRDPVRCAEAIIDRVGRDLVLAVPIGIGKPVLLLNALYRLAEADRRLRLKIFTGLTLVRPQYRSGLEQRFVEPLLARLFGSYPEPHYVGALRAGTLPRNVEVHEFFLQAGAWLSVAGVQQNYVSMNYTHVASHLQRLGTNVMAQLVAPDPLGSTRLSLASNTDITLDLLSYVSEGRGAGKRLAVAAELNGNLPYMPGAAEMERGELDAILAPEGPAYDLFAPPKEPVPLADYAMALHAATFVKDGGTLQIGIGSFADALSHVLVLRHTRNDEFRSLVTELGGMREGAELAPFRTGLYGCSEMLVDGFLALRRAGILKRRVAADGQADKAVVLHAGFFVGSQSFYRELREMPRDELEEIGMTAISFTNSLLGHEALKREQRQHARFINTGMIATLLGAVSSDQLADGRVVSGVGGQHDFVAMAHDLPDARSIIAVRSFNRRGGVPLSNIVWDYANTTIPRHLRDVIVTEYGAADLRGKPDREVAIEMLKVADSAFQPGLLQRAIRAGKLEAGYSLPDGAGGNRTARISRALEPARRSGLLPRFPLGTEMTDTEQALTGPLGRLKSASKLELLRMLVAGAVVRSTTEGERKALARMSLQAPSRLTDRLLRLLLLGALR